MEFDNLIQSLSPLERKVLPLVGNSTPVTELMEKSGLKDVEVVRAFQWLSNKKLVDIVSSETDVIELGSNGKKYLEEGLPERRLLTAISKGAKKLDDIKMDRMELNVSIGLLKRKVAIEFVKGVLSITDQGKKILEKGFTEEEFLKTLASTPMEVSSVGDEEKFCLDNLKKRKDIIKITTIKTKTASLTELGKKVPKDLGGDVIERITPELLSKGEWKNKKFRRYDVEINVPRRSFGRRHFVREAVDYARSVWTDMGFKEMQGQLVQTSFWNFDALFTAQDHPVRDLHDTFFLKDPEKGTLPDKKLTGAVKKAHEAGVEGSTGWGYKWNPEAAKTNVLRTHTTVLSAQTLSALTEEDLPAKFFSVGKCFRNETLDYSHLFEFYQVEGIIVDPKANFRHLIGYLTTFFKKMGFTKIRVRPGYFPYTEPSAEVDAYDSVRGEWLELAGAGIFRPELVVPLMGKNVPVLAFGLGLARTVRDYYKITDIRDLYRNDLKQTREMKLWLK